MKTEKVEEMNWHPEREREVIHYSCDLEEKRRKREIVRWGEWERKRIYKFARRTWKVKDVRKERVYERSKWMPRKRLLLKVIHISISEIRWVALRHTTDRIQIRNLMKMKLPLLSWDNQRTKQTNRVCVFVS